MLWYIRFQIESESNLKFHLFAPCAQTLPFANVINEIYSQVKKSVDKYNSWVLATINPS